MPMLKELSCGHQLMLQCFSDPEEIQCEEKVRIITVTRVGQITHFIITYNKLL